MKEGCWENRGFLYGPVIPIYGAGAAAITLVMRLLAANGHSEPGRLQLFLICFFGSAVLEFSTHWLLEKLFHARWWDYSDMPLNINGRICLPASTLFGLSGMWVIYTMNPVIDRYTAGIADIWAELAGMLTLALFMMDTTLTISALTDFAINVRNAEEVWNRQMSNAVTKTADTVNSVQTKTADALKAGEEYTLRYIEHISRNMGHMRKNAISRIRRISVPARPQVPGIPDAIKVAEVLHRRLKSTAFRIRTRSAEKADGLSEDK